MKSDDNLFKFVDCNLVIGNLELLKNNKKQQSVASSKSESFFLLFFSIMKQSYYA